jgi:hypothetical protein
LIARAVGFFFMLGGYALLFCARALSRRLNPLFVPRFRRSSLLSFPFSLGCSRSAQFVSLA